MSLTKYEVQDLVENTKINLYELKKRTATAEIDEKSATLVYSAIDMLKEKIIDELYWSL